MKKIFIYTLIAAIVAAAAYFGYMEFVQDDPKKKPPPKTTGRTKAEIEEAKTEIEAEKDGSSSLNND